MDEKTVIKDLTQKEIKQYLTNRYPFLLIDHITEVYPGKKAIGYKNLTANEWFFPVHFPEEPMVPGMIQTEALLQMLSMTVLTLEGNKQKLIRVSSAGKIRLKKRVVPGCRLDMEATLTEYSPDCSKGFARGLVAGEEVCSAEYVFSLYSPSEDCEAKS